MGLPQLCQVRGEKKPENMFNELPKFEDFEGWFDGMLFMVSNPRSPLFVFSAAWRQ